MTNAPIDELFSTLKKRLRPEDVAAMILNFRGATYSSNELVILRKATSSSIKEKLLSILNLSSMPAGFHQPVGMKRQVSKAQKLFASATLLSESQYSDPVFVENFIRGIQHQIRKEFGANNFKQDRRNRKQRAESRLDISKRQYNKRFRMLTRMEEKLARFRRELKKLEFTLIGKSLLASRIEREDFMRDPDSACFIAYYVARCNLRSKFTINGQERAYDDIAEMLLQHALRATPDYFTIARVFPEQSIVDRLSNEQKCNLLGEWLKILHDVAELLEFVWMHSKIERDTMIVRRGNDSTTWNNTASAWNKARSSWIRLVYSLGMDDVLDVCCPGKVLRLMAADVAAWHKRSGGALEPDTAVWNSIPLPWNVLNGRESCTRQLIAEVCSRCGVDPVKKGWTEPPPDKQAQPFRPTPELVHGVEVSSPELALLLRKVGVFSGKAKLDGQPIQVIVHRDQHGFAIGASQPESTS